MRKSEVYSWRVSPDLKMALEFEARREQTSVADLLGQIARSWLGQRSRTPETDVEQARLQAAAARSFGTVAGRDPHRAEKARAAVHRRLERRHGR
jgi:hypothetical protein